jgi:DnaJ-class molecular chaperone
MRKDEALNILNIKEGFKLTELKDVYKKLSKIYHPDVKITGCEVKFKKVVMAYEYLLGYKKSVDSKVLTHISILRVNKL